MSIILNKDTRLLVQGITGKQGLFHTQQMLDYGTAVVGGVTPGKGGETALGVRVFDTVAEAKRETGANASIIFVPPMRAVSSVYEAVDAGIETVICITEGIPVLDMLGVKRYLDGKPVRLIGPNCPGVIVPQVCKAGIMPGYIHKKGRVGVVSRSGTLTYEAVNQLTELGIGQSAAVGIGGDPVKGTDFIDILRLYEQDEETLAVVLIGEIGGDGEERAAKWIEQNMTKPVAAFIAGASAPKEKRMGHAGAIISQGKGTAESKIAALEGCGAAVAKTPDLIGASLLQAAKRAGIEQKIIG